MEHYSELRCWACCHGPEYAAGLRERYRVQQARYTAPSDSAFGRWYRTVDPGLIDRVGDAVAAMPTCAAPECAGLAAARWCFWEVMRGVHAARLHAQTAAGQSVGEWRDPRALYALCVEVGT